MKKYKNSTGSYRVETDKNGQFLLYSYNCLVAKTNINPANNVVGVIYEKYFHFSITTSRHIHTFFRDFLNIVNIKDAIKSYNIILI